MLAQGRPSLSFALSNCLCSSPRMEARTRQILFVCWLEKALWRGRTSNKWWIFVSPLSYQKESFGPPRWWLTCLSKRTIWCFNLSFLAVDVRANQLVFLSLGAVANVDFSCAFRLRWLKASGICLWVRDGFISNDATASRCLGFSFRLVSIRTLIYNDLDDGNGSSVYYDFRARYQACIFDKGSAGFRTFALVHTVRHGRKVQEPQQSCEYMAFLPKFRSPSKETYYDDENKYYQIPIKRWWNKLVRLPDICYLSMEIWMISYIFPLRSKC